jgi:hypothetical protein
VEVAEVSDRCVTLSDGRMIRDVDAILMGTGYTAPVHDPKLKLDDDRKYFMRVSAPGTAETDTRAALQKDRAE